jgi:hypothetical protein
MFLLSTKILLPTKILGLVYDPPEKLWKTIHNGEKIEEVFLIP